MKQVRIGSVPLEWFTGAGELRSHDKLGNKLTSRDVIGYIPMPVSKVFTKTIVIRNGKYAVINKVLTQKDLFKGVTFVRNA